MIAMGRSVLVGVCVALLGVRSSAQQPAPPEVPSKALAPAKGPSEIPAAQRPLGFYAVPPKVSLDVVSFKPCAREQFGSTKIDMPLDGDYIAYHCQPIGHLIYFAYVNAVSNFTLVKGYPSWVDTDRYEFIAKVAPEDLHAWQQLSVDQRRVVMRAILADTVKLKMQLDATPQPVYLLIVDKHGPKLKPYKAGEQQKLPDGSVQDGRVVNYVGVTEYGQGQYMRDISSALTAHLDRPVLDRTNVTMQFNFVMPAILGTNLSPQQRWNDDAPSIAEGLADLGLKLEPGTVPIERLVVDHVEKPSEN